MITLIVDFIGNDKVYTFLHTTTSEDACKNIFENGFEFYDFSKTTDNVNNDSVTVGILILYIYAKKKFKKFNI